MQLPYSFAVPDVLYLEELEEQHGDLPAFGLQVKSLNSNSVDKAIALQIKYTGTSPNDLFALTLAQQEDCPLLTGDQALRDAAKKEGVAIKGTIWIIKQLVTEGIIDCDDAVEAFAIMRAKGRRLPWSKASQMVESLR